MRSYKAIMLSIFALAVISGCDKGSVFNGEKRATDAGWRLESAGWNMRVYEFTPVTADHITCIVVTGTNKGSMQCFPKKENQNDQ